jgi:WD40 repeat protein
MKNSILVLATTLVAVSCNAQTKLWTQKGNPLNNSINSVAFRDDGLKVISGTNCHPSSIRIFDVTNGNKDWDYTLGSSFMCIMGVTFSANSNYIAAIEEMGNIILFDNTGTLPVAIDTISTGTSYGFSTAISPANDKLVVGCSNGKLKLYNLPGGSLTSSLNAHTSWVTTVAYAPNGNYLVTGGDDNKVKIWTPSGTLLHTCLGHSGDITNVKVTPDNLYVVSSSKDSSIKVWDISNGTLIKTITGHNDAVNGIAVSPDGLQIASASADGSCKVWDFSTTSQLFSFGEPDSNALNTAAWSSISNKIVTGSINSDVTLWDVSTPSDFKKMKNELEFALFPNPTAHFIQLYVSDIERIKSIQITSPSGKVVYLSSIFTNSISIDEWASGQYIVTLTSKNDKSISKTILISR